MLEVPCRTRHRLSFSAASHCVCRLLRVIFVYISLLPAYCQIPFRWRLTEGPIFRLFGLDEAHQHGRTLFVANQRDHLFDGLKETYKRWIHLPTVVLVRV